MITLALTLLSGLQIYPSPNAAYPRESLNTSLVRRNGNKPTADMVNRLRVCFKTDPLS